MNRLRRNSIRGQLTRSQTSKSFPFFLFFFPFLFPEHFHFCHAANSPPQHPSDFGFFVIGQYGRSECADKSPGAVDERVKNSEFTHMFLECSRHCHGTSRECSPNHRNSSDPPGIWACSCPSMVLRPMRRLAPHGGRVRARRRALQE